MVHPSVLALMEILPPPPIDTGGRFVKQHPPPLRDSGGDCFDWDVLAERTGWRYPSDYRDFLEVYGAGGTISHCLGISSPHPAGVEFRVDPRTVYPPENDLSIWGGTDDATDYYWRCADPDPELWTVAVRSRDRIWSDYPMGMVDFLLAVFDHRVELPPLVISEFHPLTFKGWREFDREVLDEYPDFKGTWAPSELPDRWYDT